MIEKVLSCSRRWRRKAISLDVLLKQSVIKLWWRIVTLQPWLLHSRPSSPALEHSYCVKVGGFLFPPWLYFLPFFFVSPRHPIQSSQSYSHLQSTNLLASRYLLLLLLLLLAFIASVQGRMRNHYSSFGNLLSLLVFQQWVRSVINLSFHLHVQQEEEWDWPFINNIRKGMNPALPLCRFHFLTWQCEDEPAVDQLDLIGDEAAQDIKLSVGKGGRKWVL